MLYADRMSWLSGLLSLLNFFLLFYLLLQLFYLFKIGALFLLSSILLLADNYFSLNFIFLVVKLLILELYQNCFQLCLPSAQRLPKPLLDLLLLMDPFVYIRYFLYHLLVELKDVHGLQLLHFLVHALETVVHEEYLLGQLQDLLVISKQSSLEGLTLRTPHLVVGFRSVSADARGYW
jgi:hypothetical protein